jgi:hypothetical protein
MGSLLLTVIELLKTIEIIRTGSEDHSGHSPNYPRVIFVARAITYISRFLFHCVQFTFVFRYGNVSYSLQVLFEDYIEKFRLSSIDIIFLPKLVLFI